ncbi:enoyl-CoA hydratase/isomerase family protein [Pseudomonas sp. NPDC086251]|uniref:enoyl-CoA hydratase/isomerase family protein n=1 Tax=Pseudomonas sp. NPDC086251 TaxID=3364431 RepID=UPI003833D212
MFRLEFSDDIAVVLLDAAPVNAMTFASWATLPDLIREAEQHGAKALVFSGQPHKHFCAGNDVREFKDLTPQDTLRGVATVRAAVKAVHESRLPAIAALHGAVMGSGLILACACDIRVATADARLGLPEVKVNSYGGFAMLSETLPRGEARSMTLTGNPISGARAFELGMVQELADNAPAVLEKAMQITAQITSTLTGRLADEIKAVMNNQEQHPLWQSYELEREFASRIMGTAGNS